MTLAEYFNQDPPLSGRKNSLVQSGWLDVADFTLRSGKFLIVDAMFLPNESDGAVVETPPGDYRIQAKVFTFFSDLNFDRRIACVRAVLNDAVKPKRKKEIGETWTDMATTAICDSQSMLEAWRTNDDEAQSKVKQAMSADAAFGSFIFDASKNVEVLFFASGFGDGTFPVYELVSDKKRVGFEIEFISKDEDYSFPASWVETVDDLRAKAEQGDAKSQFKLGARHHNSKPANYVEALKWLELAAAQNHPEAIYGIGQCHRFGRGVPVDEVTARNYFERAASLQHPAATTDLAICYKRGLGGPTDDAKAVELLQRAVNQGDARAELFLGVRYLTGDGVSKDVERAVKLIESAATRNYAPACNLIGACYQTGSGVPKKEDLAFYYFTQGAAKEDTNCMNSLANCFRDGRGTEKDLIRAELLYRKAASLGHAEAAKNLAALGESGQAQDPS